MIRPSSNTLSHAQTLEEFPFKIFQLPFLLFSQVHIQVLETVVLLNSFLTFPLAFLFSSVSWRIKVSVELLIISFVPTTFQAQTSSHIFFINMAFCIPFFPFNFLGLYLDFNICSGFNFVPWVLGLQVQNLFFREISPVVIYLNLIVIHLALAFFVVSLVNPCLDLVHRSNLFLALHYFARGSTSLEQF